MEFSRQEYWSGLLFPSPRDLPNPGMEPGSLTLYWNKVVLKVYHSLWQEGTNLTKYKNPTGNHKTHMGQNKSRKPHRRSEVTIWWYTAMLCMAHTRLFSKSVISCQHVKKSRFHLDLQMWKFRRPGHTGCVDNRRWTWATSCFFKFYLFIFWLCWVFIATIATRAFL